MTYITSFIKITVNTSQHPLNINRDLFLNTKNIVYNRIAAIGIIVALFLSKIKFCIDCVKIIVPRSKLNSSCLRT